jgi:hypothetical protein
MHDLSEQITWLVMGLEKKSLICFLNSKCVLLFNSLNSIYCFITQEVFVEKLLCKLGQIMRALSIIEHAPISCQD